MNYDEFPVFQHIIGSSPEIISLKDKAYRVAMSNSTILITGETGTGKGLLARAIHSASARSNAPFIEVNCGAIPENLIESELFGYTKGSFTGALREGKKGKFLLADKGSIFLDEIGEMPLHLQVKLLHVLQYRMVEPIGASEAIPVNIRIIAASNKDLESMINNGSFRADLYFRLGVIPLHLPPLRERKSDIPLLAAHLLNDTDITVEPEVFDVLKAYRWPGNIRELENALEYTVSFMQDKILRVRDLPPHLFQTASAPANSSSRIDITYREHILLFEKELFATYLNRYGDSTEGKQIIAKKLDIGLATLYRKLAALKLK